MNLIKPYCDGVAKLPRPCPAHHKRASRPKFKTKIYGFTLLNKTIIETHIWKAVFYKQILHKLNSN